jgi:magnesium-transporting ATPase (P-type)
MVAIHKMSGIFNLIKFILLFSTGKPFSVFDSSFSMRAFIGCQAVSLQTMHSELKNDSELAISSSFENSFKSQPLTSDPDSHSLSWPIWIAIAVVVMVFILIVVYLAVMLWQKYRYFRFASNIRNVI